MDTVNRRIKFVIPVIMEDITDKCLEKYDLDWKDLILIDNSKEGFCKKYEGKGAAIYYHPENAGVSKSWNYGVKSDADYLWVLSSSLVFKHGFSELIEKMEYANDFGLLTNQAWHCLCLGRKTMDMIGLFDEKFYPGYFEDNDYLRRMKLAKIHDLGEYQMPKVELDVECQGTALAMKAGKVEVDFATLLAYYVEKWGGNPGQEIFDLPFAGRII